ncbi:hypothetical protein EAY42_17925, partial [Vibrio anguillarum]|nr:hypothetical protein [Vibrio anguillarum]
NLLGFLWPFVLCYRQMSFLPSDYWFTQTVKQTRFLVCLNEFWCWFVGNSACAKCGKGKLIEHFAFAEVLAR